MKQMKEARALAGLSRRSLAMKMAEISGKSWKGHDNSLAGWESGRNSPSWDSIQLWAEALGVEASLTIA